jgi:hypothetical protein
VVRLGLEECGKVGLDELCGAIVNRELPEHDQWTPLRAGGKPSARNRAAVLLQRGQFTQIIAGLTRIRAV